MTKLVLKKGQLVPKNYTGEVVMRDGDIVWYKDGEIHREDGPAIECANGETEWYFNGKLHRTDGPAITFTHGYKNWNVDGQSYYFGKEPLKITDFIILDEFIGKYDLTWYKFIDKHGDIKEIPDIPGLLIK